MKKTIKKICALSLVATMMIASATTAEAKHLPGCGASTRIQKCGSYRTSTTGRHHLHTNVYCSWTGYVYDHYYICAGCKQKVANGSKKICYKVHQYCPREIGLCN